VSGANFGFSNWEQSDRQQSEHLPKRNIYRHYKKKMQKSDFTTHLFWFKRHILQPCHNVMKLVIDKRNHFTIKKMKTKKS
jgi:hypothetical protein